MAEDYSKFGMDTSQKNFKNNILIKLIDLENYIKELRLTQTDTIKILQGVDNEKSQVVNELNDEISQLTTELNFQIEEMLRDLKKHQANQRSNGLKIQQEISVLKKEKLEIQQRISGLIKKISDMEMTIGNDVK